MNSKLIMKTRIQKLLVGAAMVGVATLAQAQFTYTNNGNGTCTITGYTGPGGAANSKWQIEEMANRGTGP